jgi:hypothetical protein
VFVLLETIYREFDRIAKRRKVFKVEVLLFADFQIQDQIML